MTPLIKRLSRNSIVTIPLSDHQKEHIAVMKQKISNGQYKLEGNQCICGGESNDILVAEKDRYGFDLSTKLCSNCGLLRSDPYYEYPTLNEFYKNEFEEIYRGNFDIDNYFVNRQKVSYEIYDFLKEFLEKDDKKKRVFDLGCGSGALLVAFNENGHETYGCDLGEKYISYGISKGLNLFKGDIDVLEAYGKADVVILNHSLEHFTNPKEYIIRVKSMLKEDGLIYIAVPGVMGSLARHYKNDYLRFFQNSHAYHFSLTTLNNLMKSVGLDCVKGTEEVQAIYKFRNEELDNDSLTQDKQEVENIKSFILELENKFLELKKKESSLTFRIKRKLKKMALV